jgi:hypothetical protein
MRRDLLDKYPDGRRRGNRDPMENMVPQRWYWTGSLWYQCAQDGESVGTLERKAKPEREAN